VNIKVSCASKIRVDKAGELCFDVIAPSKGAVMMTISFSRRSRAAFFCLEPPIGFDGLYGSKMIPKAWILGNEAKFDAFLAACNSAPFPFATPSFGPQGEKDTI
jgi:hypothetical protein